MYPPAVSVYHLLRIRLVLYADLRLWLEICRCSPVLKLVPIAFLVHTLLHGFHVVGIHQDDPDPGRFVIPRDSGPGRTFHKRARVSRVPCALVRVEIQTLRSLPSSHVKKRPSLPQDQPFLPRWNLWCGCSSIFRCPHPVFM